MLEIKYVGHACVLLRSQSERVLIDPWFSPSLNDETLHAVPPPAALTFEEIDGLTAIHISHMHSDHFSEETLARFPKKIPVIVAKHKDGVFASRIRAIGFDHVVEVEPGPGGYVMGDLRLCVFLPSQGYPYDSSLVVTCAGRSYLFDNDARFSSDHYFLLACFFGEFEAAFVGYADIYPFPLIYDFSVCRGVVAEGMNEKTLSHLEEQSWRRIESICEHLRPKWVCPYAASIRFRHPELLDFNRMFFAKAGILARDLGGAVPISLRHGDIVAAGQVPSSTLADFDEPHIEPIACRHEGSRLEEEIRQNAEMIFLRLRDLLVAVSSKWVSAMTVAFLVGEPDDEIFRYGFLFDGSDVLAHNAVESEYDLVIRIEPRVAWKILFENWSLQRASYSYRLSVIVRRIVAGQIAVHRWS